MKAKILTILRLDHFLSKLKNKLLATNLTYPKIQKYN